MTPEPSSAFRDWFAVPAGASRILSAFYRAPGCLTRQKIAELSSLSIASVSVYISWLRKALDAEAIDTRYEETTGRVMYGLTDAGRDECDLAMDDATRRAA